LQAWQTLKRKRVLNHPVLQVDLAQRSRGGEEAHEFVVLHSPDWVNVVPLTSDGQVVLIRQWRHGTGEVTLEIPGGLIDPGESPGVAGARELEEETGYQPDRMEPMGWVHPNPALFSNRCYTCLALGCKKVGPPRLEDTEQIQVELKPLEKLPELIKNGEISHSLVVVALFRYLMSRGELARTSELL
jgi:ADP-ribose pyrophosphatase